MSGDAPDRVLVGDVLVEGLVAEHGESAGVREDVAERAALLSIAPTVDVIGDEVVEPEPAVLPELEESHRGERLTRRVPEHQIVGSRRPPRDRLADGDVEHGLPADRDVALGAAVAALSALQFEDLDDGRGVNRFGIALRLVKSDSHGVEA